MTALSNVSELNNLFAKLNQVSGNGSGSSDFSKGFQSYNDIAWFANAITTASTEEATPEQKASAIQGMVQKALNIFEKIMGNEAQSAKKETNKETKATQALLEKSKNLEAELNGSLTEIQTNIESQTEIITEAQKLLIETQEAIKEKQEQIEVIVKQIEAKQQELASAETPEEKAAILAEIQGFAVSIAEIGATIEVDAENIANLTQAVDDTVVDIEESTQKLAETEQTGIQELGQQAAEAAQLSGEVAETGTKGATNKVTGEAAEKAAEAASTNIFSGASIAPKLYMTANDQKQASSTRLASIAGNINKLAQGIGGLSNATDVLAGFQHSIGGALSNYAELFGQWDAQLQPAIVSLGSFDLLAQGLDELNTAVDTDLDNLGFEVDESGEVQKTEENKKDKPAENNNESPLTQTETEKFDIQKLRTFGV